jgi:elongation factor Ts
MVKDLRARTDLPMMECKQALTECEGDIEAALEWLRKKHRGKMAERADRTTGEGRIGVYIDDARKVGALIELQCETAPVAKNELFVNLANDIAKTVAAGSQAAPDPETMRKDPEVDSKLTDVFGRLRETMNLRKCRRVEGAHLASYIHHDGKSGVMLALDAEPQSEKAIAADLCMHTLFTDPVAVDRSGVPAEQVDKVRSEAIEIARAEGKPEQIVEKIALGKVNAFFGDRVLMEQLHVKTDEYGKKARIGDVLKQAGVSAVTDLVIMKVGA